MLNIEIMCNITDKYMHFLAIFSVKRVSKDATYTVVIICGLGVTGKLMIFYIYMALYVYPLDNCYLECGQVENIISIF